MQAANLEELLGTKLPKNYYVYLGKDSKAYSEEIGFANSEEICRTAVEDSQNLSTYATCANDINLLQNQFSSEAEAVHDTEFSDEDLKLSNSPSLTEENYLREESQSHQQNSTEANYSKDFITNKSESSNILNEEVLRLESNSDYSSSNFSDQFYDIPQCSEIPCSSPLEFLEPDFGEENTLSNCVDSSELISGECNESHLTSTDKHLQSFEIAIDDNCQNFKSGKQLSKSVKKRRNKKPKQVKPDVEKVQFEEKVNSPVLEERKNSSQTSAVLLSKDSHIVNQNNLDFDFKSHLSLQQVEPDNRDKSDSFSNNITSDPDLVVPESVCSSHNSDILNIIDIQTSEQNFPVDTYSVVDEKKSPQSASPQILSFGDCSDTRDPNLDDCLNSFISETSEDRFCVEISNNYLDCLIPIVPSKHLEQSINCQRTDNLDLSNFEVTETDFESNQADSFVSIENEVPYFTVSNHFTSNKFDCNSIEFINSSLVNPSLDTVKLLGETESRNDLNSKRDSILSLSCYGSDDFEIFSLEAQNIVESLKTCTTYEKDVTMNHNTSDCSEKLASVSLDEESIRCAERIEEKMNKKKYEEQLFEVGDSEAGPEIATGITSSDLKCATDFFREANELEKKIRKNINSPYGSLSEFSCEPEKSNNSMGNNSDSTDMKTAPVAPPREERSAPEGTSSPDPRTLEDAEVRSRTIGSSRCADCREVNDLLKKQALEFEEKFLRQGIVSAEKEKELHELLKEEQQQMQKVTASRDALLKLVDQYKGMFATLVAEKQKGSQGLEEKVKTLEDEKRVALEDLNNVEVAFSDVHRKYERTKQVVDSLKRNEEILRNAVADYEDKLQKHEKKFIEFQKHAEEKINMANDEYESVQRSSDQEMTKMAALLKKAEMKIISLQESLDRKVKENQELSKLCDDLIRKVGS